MSSLYQTFLFLTSPIVGLLCTSLPTCIADELPNIIVIYADDMGFGDLAIQNPNSKIATPHLDKLATEGMRFTDAHSSSGICTPSRYALLTGRYHWRKMHGIVPVWGQSVFAPERLTLPEMLKTKGYRTACIGKWHLGFDWTAIQKADAKPTSVRGKKVYSTDDFDWSKPLPDGPLDHGFDYYFGDDVPNYPPYTWIENERITKAPTVPYVPDPKPSEGAAEGRPGPMVEGWKQDAVMPALTEKAVQWIAQQKGTEKPFFLYWPWTSPHAPIVPTENWKGKSDAGGYGDFVAQSDHQAGEVLRALDENGFRDNTIVIFTADNGPERYAYDRVRNHQHHSTGPLRGLKRDIFEGGHRVPFIVRWPGVVKAGSVTDELISQIDVMATIASVIGFELHDGMAEDSHNQMSLWKGGESARTSLVHNTKKDHYAIRQDNWVLIDGRSGYVSGVPAWYAKEYDPPKNEQTRALFDLNEDLGQRTNQFAIETERAQKLLELLDSKRKFGEVRSLESNSAR